MIAHLHYLLVRNPHKQQTHANPSFLLIIPILPLIHRTCTRKNPIRIHTRWYQRIHPLTVRGKKMFSNMLHLPLFVSIVCPMSLPACKLIYNAVLSWIRVEVGGGMMAETVQAKGLGLGARFRVGHGVRNENLRLLGQIWLGQFSSLAFFAGRREGLGLLLALGLLWQPQRRALFEWRNEMGVCLCVCLFFISTLKWKI